MSLSDHASLQRAYEEAEALRRTGKLWDTLRMLEQIVQARAQSGLQTLTAADLILRERLAELYVVFDAFISADTLLQQCVRAYEQAGNGYGASYIGLKRVTLALEVGDVRQAQQLLDALRPSMGDCRKITFTTTGLAHWEAEWGWADLPQTERRILLILAYLCMGRLLCALGQYTQGICALERGLHHLGAARKDETWLRTPLLFALAAGNLEQGDLPGATARLEVLQAEARAETHPVEAVRARELLAKCDLLRGDFGGALDRLREITTLCRQRGFVAAGERALFNLTHALILCNQTSLARSLLETVATEADSRGDPATADRARWLMQLADARCRSLVDEVWAAAPVSQSEYRRITLPGASKPPAEPPARKSWPENPPEESFLGLFHDRTLAFHFALAEGDHEASKYWLDRLKRTFGSSDSALIAVHLQVLEGGWLYYTGQHDQAERLLRKAVAEAQRLGLVPEQWQAQRLLIWTLHALQRQDNLGQLGQSNEILLNRMSLSLKGMDRTFFLLNKWTQEEEDLGRAVTQLHSLRQACQRTTWWRRGRLARQLQAEIHVLWERIHRIPQEPETQDKNSALKRCWRSLWRHPRDHASLTFLTLPSYTLVICRCWLYIDFELCAVQRGQLRELVTEWVRSIRQVRTPGEIRGAASELKGAPSDLRITLETLHALGARIAEILHLPDICRTLPPRVQGLILQPDDTLHGAPFAALHVNGKYLAERFALSSVFNVSALPDRPRPTGTEALTLAVSRGGVHTRDLPSVEPEAEIVSECLRRNGMTVHALGNDTTPDRLLTDLPGKRLFHAGCHGVFDAEEPDQSGLLLVPEAGREARVTMRALCALDLSQIDHVTLAACWSADYFTLPGRWILSLPETLLASGVRSCLNSLWQVDDAVSYEFMAAFYDYLAKYPRDEALRKAQVNCIHRKASPYFWAGLILYGDHRPIRW